MKNFRATRNQLTPIPADILPPEYESNALRSQGCWRKKWRYIGFFSSDIMLCIAKAQVGPLPCSWWALWDRSRQTLYQKTYLRPQQTIRFSHGLTELTDYLSISLNVAEDAGVETFCPHGSKGWIWTRKQGARPAHCQITLPTQEKVTIEGLAVVDDTLGYHERHTEWFWSAGVGQDQHHRTVSWNLVNGVNDPDHQSERTLWIDGLPQEVEPVQFAKDLSKVDFSDESTLQFHTEANRQRNDNLLYFQSRYEQPFGTFSGNISKEITLQKGFGVMEHHIANW